MAQSSNIGFAKIALNYLHEEKLTNTPPRSASASAPASSPSRSNRRALRPVSKWSALSITRIPMGQEVGATPIQLVTAMSVIANGGRLIVPRLAKQVTDATGRVVKVYQPKVVRQVISADAARESRGRCSR